ncbi:MAG: nucleotide exchange factor GrpE [Chloroflexota bacterium]|nr:nucleotide exchange factor GrpE [Chloroflexota bacterium]
MEDNRLGPEEMEEKPASEGVEGTVEAGQGEQAPAAEEIEDIDTLREMLAKEQARTEKYLANWQRSQADFINYKKRTEQERGEVVKFANAALVLNLLTVLDDLARALENVSGKLSGLTWVDGIELIYRKLKAILEGSGLCEIKAVGEPFDPNFHEAVCYACGDEDKCVEEVQKGYMLHDRVLRPAMVKVGSGDKEVTEGEVQEESNG